MLQYKDGGLKHISELHRSYDPLQHPLIFPPGTDGWHVNLKLQNSRKLTAICMVYYRYHINQTSLTTFQTLYMALAIDITDGRGLSN